MSEYHFDGSPKQICGDPNCHAGTIGDWNYAFKDGPCAGTPNKPCQWPEDRPTPRPHFTDFPSKPVFDAGAAALKDKQELLRRLERL